MYGTTILVLWFYVSEVGISPAKLLQYKMYQLNIRSRVIVSACVRIEAMNISVLQ